MPLWILLLTVFESMLWPLGSSKLVGCSLFVSLSLSLSLSRDPPPPLFATDMGETLGMGLKAHHSMIDSQRQFQPTGRTGTCDDMVKMVAFLGNDEQSG